VSGGFSVTIDDLAVSARTFSRLHTDAVAALGTAAAGLAAHAGMAGDDPVLAGWRDLFDRLAVAVWAVHATAAATLADIAGKLVATGNGYLDAEAASGGDPGARIPPTPPPGPPPRPPPSSTGPRGPAVPAELADYWPGGDPDALRTAGAVWSGLADRSDDTARGADAAFRSLTGANSGATFSAIAAYWERHYQSCGVDPLFNATSTCAQQLGLACVALAAAIETSRHEMGRAALEASEDLAHVELPAHLLGRFTRGATVAILEVGKAALATKLLDGYRHFYLKDVDRLVGELRRIDLAHLHALAAPPPPQPAVEVGLQDVGEVLRLGLAGSAWDDVDGPGPDEVHLTDEFRGHILDGDDRGGGHGSGRGRADKSEFPAVWGDDRVLVAIMAVARDPDRIEFNPGTQNWNVEKRIDGILIRVAVDASGSIVTAHPLESPGITRHRR
jgi:hypothetical protein